MVKARRIRSRRFLRPALLGTRRSKRILRKKLLYNDNDGIHLHINSGIHDKRTAAALLKKKYLWVRRQENFHSLISRMKYENESQDDTTIGSFLLPKGKFTCKGCQYSSYTIIQNCHIPQNSCKDVQKTADKWALSLFKKHGVIPSRKPVFCPDCPGKAMTKMRDGVNYRCYNMISTKKKKGKKQCQRHVNIYKGTFLQDAKISPAKLLLFINEYISHDFREIPVMDNLGIASNTFAYWRKKCDEVCLKATENVAMIGGIKEIVEIDESIIARTKFCVNGKARPSNSVWLFGGTERYSLTHKAFVYVLLEDDHLEKKTRNERLTMARDKETLIPIIQKYVKPGSIIISDGWAAYNGLGGPLDGVTFYTHVWVNHTIEFVNFTNPFIHTNCIERFWLVLKDYMHKPGMRLNRVKHHVGRALILTSSRVRRRAGTHHARLVLNCLAERRKLHLFLSLIGRTYPPRIV